MLAIVIVILGAAAAWLLSDALLAPLARIATGAADGPPLARVGRTFFGRWNVRPAAAAYLRSLEARLVRSGRPGTAEQTLSEAQGAGLVAGVGFVALFGLAAGAFNVLLVVLGVGVGTFVGWLMLARVDGWVTERRKQLGRQFPYFLDLAVMSMDSGTGMLEVVDAYVRSAPGTALARELTALQADIRMGSTVDAALVAMEGRIPADDVVAVSRSIRQGLRMGTPLAQVFREQAESMRFKRSQAAERAAEELKVKLQGPAMLLVIAVLVLVLGPAIVGMITGEG